MILRFLAACSGLAVILGVAWGVSAGAQTAQPADPAQPKDQPSARPADASVTTTDANAKPADKKSATKAKTEKATFATGCFWCGEAVFERIKGVNNVVSGYTGGNVPNPTYEMVSTGQTGHAEAFQVDFDPSVTSYEKMLNAFWASHDPTTPNQQGPDFGTQYRSAIFYANESQKLAAQKSFEEIAKKNNAFASVISTELTPLSVFYPAEAYHQDYYKRHKSAMYCQTYITPKLKKLHLLDVKPEKSR